MHVKIDEMVISADETRVTRSSVALYGVTVHDDALKRIVGAAGEEFCAETLDYGLLMGAALDLYANEDDALEALLDKYGMTAVEAAIARAKAGGES